MANADPWDENSRLEKQMDAELRQLAEGSQDGAPKSGEAGPPGTTERGATEPGK
jgi:hypothetical protein